MKKLSTIFIMALMALSAVAAQPKDIIIYINPGHGGHDSDDRNVAIPPYAQGDPEGFWESNSNLDKGLMLRDLLQAKGCKVVMSRVTNTTADDLGLETIGHLANASNADAFFSIHSNATGTGSRVNFPLMLFRGYDTESQIPGAKKLAETLFPHLVDNDATVWTSTNPNIRGDWSFYHDWGTQGLGVLRVLSVPGMLSEGSFHDYIPETYRLMNMDFKWLESWHFVKAVDDFFQFEPETLGNIAGCIYDSHTLRTEDYKKFGRDLSSPIHGALVQLIDATGKIVDSYTTDNLQNGIYVFKSIVPGNYKLKVTEATHFEKEAEIVVVANKVSYSNIALDRVRNTPPEVLSYTPVWKQDDAPVLCNTLISFLFNWDMDIEATEKAFSITPNVEGTFKWEDSNYKMTFIPKTPYATNTLYTVTLNTNAKHAGGASMVKDLTFSFRTADRNFMDIIGQFPQNNEEVHYKGAMIELRTDKLINATPILKQISVKNSAGEAVPLKSRGMQYNKSDSPYGFVKIPFINDLIPGEKYVLNFSNAISDKDGITIKDGLTVNFTAVDAGATKDNATVITDFEDATQYSVTADASTGFVSATVKADASSKLFGSKCLNFDFEFVGNQGGEIVYHNANKNDNFVTSSNKIGAHIYGDMSSHEVYAIFSSETDIKYVKLCDLTFNGWKYVEIPLNTLEGDKDYSYVGIKLIQNTTPMGVKGAFKLDNLINFGKGSGVDLIEVASLTVYPNPASEYIIANADGLIEGMQLVSLSGANVADVAGNTINVSEIANGNYILKIKIAGNYAVRKVVVAHK
ncbi:MAG: N-acetylmuramoyl-L-alanine amidase [Muribaculaceae bacterium]